MGISFINSGTMARSTYDSDEDGLVDAASGGLDKDVSGYTGYLYLTSGVTSQDTTLARTTNGLQITGASSATLKATHDGTDGLITASTGNIKLVSTGGSGASAIKLTDGSSNYVTVSAPTGMSADYTWTYPTAVAAAADEVPVSGGANATLSFKDINKIVYKTIVLKGVADATAPTVSDTANGQVVIPVELNGYNLVSVGAHVYTASAASGPVALHIYNLTQTADMLSTGITIDDTELDSATAATPPVIDTGNDDVATGDVLQIHVTDIGDGAVRGLEVRMGFRLP